MTTKIFADECGRRALGIVQVAPSAQSARTTATVLPSREGRQLPAVRVEATTWAVSWVDVPADQTSVDAGGVR
jgi:hypothetical protein